MFAIKIAYSNGDQEPISMLFDTAEKAFHYACHMAAEEAYQQNTDFEDDATCTIMIDAGSYSIDLVYQVLGSWCYYRVIQLADNEPVDLAPGFQNDPQYVDGVLSITRSDDSKATVSCRGSFINRAVFAVPAGFIKMEEAKEGTFLYTDIDGRKRAVVAVPETMKDKYPYAMWYKHTAIAAGSKKGNRKSE